MSIKTQRELLIPDSLLSAENITYNNSSSGLQSDTMQGALDELAAEIPDGIIYVDADEETPDVGDIEDVTSAKFVSYNNTNSNLEATNVQEAIDEINETKVNTADIVDNLESAATDLPLSANIGRVIKEYIDNIETALRTGVNLSGRDFNNLGLVSINGQGSNMTNAPIDNPSCGYIVHQIVGENTILQFAKATNWGNGELLFFRQMRANGVWGDWLQVGLQSDIETLKSQTRKCITYVQRDATDKIYISATFHRCDKQIIVLKGSNNSAQTIFTLVHFCSFLPNSIQLTNWGAQLEVVENSVYYAKDTVQDVTELKFALSGVNQWAGIDIEFPVKTASMSVSSSEI